MLRYLWSKAVARHRNFQQYFRLNAEMHREDFDPKEMTPEHFQVLLRGQTRTLFLTIFIMFLGFMNVPTFMKLLSDDEISLGKGKETTVIEPHYIKLTDTDFSSVPWIERPRDVNQTIITDGLLTFDGSNGDEFHLGKMGDTMRLQMRQNNWVTHIDEDLTKKRKLSEGGAVAILGLWQKEVGEYSSELNLISSYTDYVEENRVILRSDWNGYPALEMRGAGESEIRIGFDEAGRPMIEMTGKDGSSRVIGLEG